MWGKPQLALQGIAPAARVRLLACALAAIEKQISALPDALDTCAAACLYLLLLVWKTESAGPSAGNLVVQHNNHRVYTMSIWLCKEGLD